MRESWFRSVPCICFLIECEPQYTAKPRYIGICQFSELRVTASAGVWAVNETDRCGSKAANAGFRQVSPSIRGIATATLVEAG